MNAIFFILLSFNISCITKKKLSKTICKAIKNLGIQNDKKVPRMIRYKKNMWNKYKTYSQKPRMNIYKGLKTVQTF